MGLNVRMSSVVPDRTAEPDYRPLNHWAILALVSGLSSVLAFAHPAFWALPVLGLLFGALALHQISTDPTYWAGEWLAKIGVALSVGLGIAGVTTTVMGWMLLKHDALRTANTFIGLLKAGQVERAFWMTVPQEWMREFNPVTHGDDAREHYRRFLISGARFFLNKDQIPEIIFEEVEEYGSDGATDYAFVRYRFEKGDFSTYALVHVATEHNSKTHRKEWYVKEMLTDYEPRSRKIPTATTHRH